MTKFRNSYLLALLAIVLLATPSCNRNDDDDDREPLPEDQKPTVTLISPDQNYSLNEVGETQTISLRFNDPELLGMYQVFEKIIDNNGNVQQQPIKIDEENISGKEFMLDYNYTVPNIPVYSLIKLEFVGLDNQGKSVSFMFNVNVIPTPNNEPFEVEEFTTTDTIYANTVGNNRNYFDFAGQNNFVLNPTRRDIGDAAGTGTFTGQLISPNNGSADSVFVVTNAASFNYEQATYSTINAAFNSNPNQLMMTPTLNAGDIVIVKVANAASPPQYAVMNIQSVTFDFVTFMYKRTF